MYNRDQHGELTIPGKLTYTHDFDPFYQGVYMPPKKASKIWTLILGAIAWALVISVIVGARAWLK
jgi:hypothetical protein